MKEIDMKRGQPITFRIPSDIPDHILRYLGQLKETEKRNFSSKIAEFVMNGVGQSLSKQRETLTIPLPKGLNKVQRNWMKHEQSLALLGSIVYQLLTDPVKTASLIASLNNSMVEIEDYPYPIEESSEEYLEKEFRAPEQPINKKIQPKPGLSKMTQHNDIDDFDWEKVMQEETAYTEEEIDENMDDLLGDFLDQMNK
jgi:hypothetical protein